MLTLWVGVLEGICCQRDLVVFVTHSWGLWLPALAVALLVGGHRSNQPGQVGPQHTWLRRAACRAGQRGGQVMAAAGCRGCELCTSPPDRAGCRGGAAQCAEQKAAGGPSVGGRATLSVLPCYGVELMNAHAASWVAASHSQGLLVALREGNDL